MKELIKKLNEARDVYYNTGKSIMSDYEYDQLFDKLNKMEKETGIIMSNSPTQNVGYEVKNKLEKVVHEYPMLSLDKTKNISDLVKFVGDKEWLMMLKMDGLTICLTYEDGRLIKAETRGDGQVGSNVLHNVRTFTNVPLEISYKEKLVIFGEAIIDYDTFYKINEKLPENERYANPRNLVSGSLNQLDSSICAERGVKFIAWRVVKGFDDVNLFIIRLAKAQRLGFDIVPLSTIAGIVTSNETMEHAIQINKESAKEFNYPIDGMVVSFQDIKYLESLGATSHHLRGQLAFKFGEDKAITTLREIEWSPSRTGALNPVGIFDEVELAGTSVSRASLHNISVMEDLNISIGAEIEVCKRNEIIPQIESCSSHMFDIKIPSVCPVCGAKTEIKQENNSKVLVCSNPNCKAKLLGKLELACSKEGFDIDGLSTAQLQLFIEQEWLNNIADIYDLYIHKTEMTSLPGLGLKSVNKLLSAIEKSKEIDLAHFIRGLGIPMIGKTQSKAISNYCHGDINEFIDLIFLPDDLKYIDGFGEKIEKSFNDWFGDDSYCVFDKLIDIFIFKKENEKTYNADLNGKVYVITGSLNHFANRDALKEIIEAAGGKVVGSVSKKTTALICNEVSNSGKSKKAKELGVPVITEKDIMEELGLNE